MAPLSGLESAGRIAPWPENAVTMPCHRSKPRSVESLAEEYLVSANAVTVTGDYIARPILNGCFSLQQIGDSRTMAEDDSSSAEFFLKPSPASEPKSDTAVSNALARSLGDTLSDTSSDALPGREKASAGSDSLATYWQSVARAACEWPNRCNAPTRTSMICLGKRAAQPSAAASTCRCAPHHVLEAWLMTRVPEAFISSPVVVNRRTFEIPVEHAGHSFRASVRRNLIAGRIRAQHRVQPTRPACSTKFADSRSVHFTPNNSPKTRWILPCDRLRCLLRNTTGAFACEFNQEPAEPPARVSTCETISDCQASIHIGDQLANRGLPVELKGFCST